MYLRRMLGPAALLAALALSACATPRVSAASVAEPAITIDVPVEGATLAVPYVVSGTADTFEASLTIDAIDETGLTMCVRHLTATSGSGTRGTWEGMLAFPPEEDPLHVTLRAYTHSPVDGAMTDLVERRLTISTERPDIIVTSPRCGDVYPAGTLIQVLGTASLFEASLIVELRNSAGIPVVTLPVTAEECCVESNFSSMLTVPAGLSSGFYDFVAYSLSPQDGSQQNAFVVQVEVVEHFEVTG